MPGQFRVLLKYDVVIILALLFTVSHYHLPMTHYIHKRACAHTHTKATFSNITIEVDSGTQIPFQRV